MKLTHTLGFLKPLVSKLHPPLSKSPRESQQLLNVLQSAFKRQLDDIHPPVNPTIDTKSSNTTSRDLTNSSADATNEHILSVLYHPLIDETAWAQGHATSSAERAVAVLHKAIINGRVNHALIAKCVGFYRKDVESHAALRDGQRLSNKISTWFKAASPTDQERFLTSPLLHGVVPVMYSDGQEQVVWEWLRMLYEGDFGGHDSESTYDPGSSMWQSYEATLVHLMIKETLRRNKIDIAIQEFAQAFNYSMRTGRILHQIEKSIQECGHAHLLRTWNMVGFYIVARGSHHGATEESFEHFLRLSQYWKNYVVSGVQSSLFAQIYHPTRPSATPLYDEVRGEQFLLYGVRWLRSQKQNTQKVFVISILDGAQLLLDEGQPGKTQFLLDFLEHNFSNFVQESRVQDNTQRILAVRHELVGFESPAILTPG